MRRWSWGRRGGSTRGTSGARRGAADVQGPPRKNEQTVVAEGSAETRCEARPCVWVSWRLRSRHRLHGGPRGRRARQLRNADRVSADRRRPDVDGGGRRTRLPLTVRTSQCAVDLEIRGNLERNYADVLTRRRAGGARRARAARRRPQGADGARGSSAGRDARPRPAAHRVPRPGGAIAADRHHRAGRPRRRRSPAARFRPTCSGSGSRAPGPAARPERAGRRRASATSPTPCCPAPTAGCSTARTRSARCRRCRSTTSATSSWPSIAIRCS